MDVGQHKAYSSGTAKWLHVYPPHLVISARSQRTLRGSLFPTVLPKPFPTPFFRSLFFTPFSSNFFIPLSILPPYQSRNAVLDLPLNLLLFIRPS